MEKIWRFLKDEEGTETVEWAILAAFLILAAGAAWATLGANVQNSIQALVTATTP